MNLTNTPAGTSHVPWPTSGDRSNVPDTSMLPNAERSAPAESSLLKNAVKGAHDTIDRLAERAAPAVHQLGENLTAAEGALQTQVHQLRETREEWVKGVRSAVRGKPLTFIATAFAMGVLIARVTR
jgi:ElaB/YqjD/DUF883 family membrane-anchored ribosome-binding protein